MTQVNIDLNNRINENELKVSFSNIFPVLLEKYFLKDKPIDKSLEKDLGVLKKQLVTFNQQIKQLNKEVASIKQIKEET